MPCFGGSRCSLGVRTTLPDTAFIDRAGLGPLRQEPVSPPTVPDHSDYLWPPKELRGLDPKHIGHEHCLAA